VDFEATREAALRLPGVEQATSYGTPAWRVGKRLFARWHQDGESLVVRSEPGQREGLLERDSKVFFVSDHYRGHPWVQVRLRAVSAGVLAEVLESAWRLRAPRRLVAELDAKR
jgi:hypothetical protein